MSPASRTRAAPAETPSGGWEIAGWMGLAAVLRFAALSRHGFWQDEVNSVVLARAPWPEFVEGLAAYPPLYFLLLRGWMFLGGGEAWVRALSALLGTVLAGLAWCVGSELRGRPGARLAALLVATAPVLVACGREARPYALLDVLLAGAVLGALRAARTGRPSDHLLLGATATAALYTHYYAGFGLLAIAVASLFGPLFQRGRRGLTLATGGGVALAFLPWLRVFATQGSALGGYASEVAAFNTRGVSLPRAVLSALVSSDPAAAVRFGPELLAIPGPWSVVAAALVAAGLAGAVRALALPLHRAICLSLVLLPALLPMVLLHTRDLFVSMKYLTILSFALALASAAALAGLRPRAAAAALALLLPLQAVRLRDLYRRPPSELREAVAFVSEGFGPGDCLLTIYNRRFVVELYAPALAPVYDLPWDVPGLGRSVPERTPLAARAVRAEDLPAVDALVDGCSTAWLLVSEPIVWGVDMGAARLRGHLLTRGYGVRVERKFADSEVAAFERRAAPPPDRR